MRSQDGASKGRKALHPELDAVPAMKRQMSDRERRLRKELRHRQLEERYDSDVLCLCRANVDIE